MVNQTLSKLKTAKPKTSSCKKYSYAQMGKNVKKEKTKCNTYS